MSKQDWERSHRRYALVNEMAAKVHMLAEPLDPRVREEFGSREHALRALHSRWVTLINGCLDVELETGADNDDSTTLARAGRHAMAHSPELHEALHSLRNDPLIDRLNHNLHIRLAEAIGFNRPGRTVEEATHEVRRILAQAVAAERAMPMARTMWRPRNPLRWSRRPEAITVV